MNDYKQITESLAAGADPAMLCATCPWDRYCITPPSMTAADVEKAVSDARQEDERYAREAELKGEKPGIAMGSLMTTLVMSGRDTSASICPVFAMRIRSSAGRGIVDGVKAQMTGWDDNDS